jgi:hypothetical protein
MGTRNARTRLCRGSVQSSMAYPSLGLGSSWKHYLTYSSVRPANLPPPVLKLYTSLQHSSIHRVGVARIELSNLFDTPSSSSLTIRSSLKSHGFSSNPEHPIVWRSSNSSPRSVSFRGTSGTTFRSFTSLGTSLFFLFWFLVMEKVVLAHVILNSGTIYFALIWKLIRSNHSNSKTRNTCYSQHYKRSGKCQSESVE